MEQFYEYTIIDNVAEKKITGVIKGSDILEMVRVLTQRYKNIDHIEMNRIPAGTVFYETDVSFFKSGRGSETDG